MTKPANMPPLAAIAFAPRQTMRAILDSSEKPATIAIVIAAMASFSLRDLDVQGFNDAALALGLSTALLLAPLILAVMALVGIVFYFLVSAAATVIGRWMLGGSGTYRNVRVAVAWGLAPQV